MEKLYRIADFIIASDPKITKPVFKVISSIPEEKLTNLEMNYLESQKNIVLLDLCLTSCFIPITLATLFTYLKRATIKPSVFNRRMKYFTVLSIGMLNGFGFEYYLKHVRSNPNEEHLSRIYEKQIFELTVGNEGV